MRYKMESIHTKTRMKGQVSRELVEELKKERKKIDNYGKPGLHIPNIFSE